MGRVREGAYICFALRSILLRPVVVGFYIFKLLLCDSAFGILLDICFLLSAVERGRIEQARRSTHAS